MENKPNKKNFSLLAAELECTNIMSSTSYIRLKVKTQVHFPRLGSSEVVHDRLSHSSEVGSSSLITSYSVALSKGWDENALDYNGSVKPCALLHDIGHPPLGHDGAKFLDAYLKHAGLPEGFSDNNNNLVVIEQNDIHVSDYTISSVIKYPDKLYPDQKDKYCEILQKSLKDDFDYFSSLGVILSPQTRTIACQIMDVSDENTYINSDLADFFCLGNTVPVDKLNAIASSYDVFIDNELYFEFLSVIASGNKNLIREYFNENKNKMNMNYTLTQEGIVPVCPKLDAFKDFLWQVELKYYISSVRLDPFHLENMKKLRLYVSNVIHNNFVPSRSYADLISKASCPTEVLRLKRDMIAATTDWFVTGFKDEANDELGIVKGLDLGPDSTIQYN